jgi:hypothetical protein
MEHSAEQQWPDVDILNDDDLIPVPQSGDQK